MAGTVNGHCPSFHDLTSTRSMITAAHYISLQWLDRYIDAWVMMGAFAEFERDVIRGRTDAGLAAARARGRMGRRPSVMNAKKIDKTRKPYDSREHTVTEIAEMLNISVATGIGPSSFKPPNTPQPMWPGC